jgi:hypothetical protein
MCLNGRHGKGQSGRVPMSITSGQRGADLRAREGESGLRGILGPNDEGGVLSSTPNGVEDGKSAFQTR